MLILTQDTRHFTDSETGDKITARTIQPSEPYGGWPGTKTTIREWKVFKNGTEGIYWPCTPDEIVNYENLLGEWKDFTIIQHATLGAVARPINHE